VQTELNSNNNQEVLDTIHEFYEKVSELIKPVVNALKNIMNALTTTFLKAWEEVKFNISFFDKNVSRKRFVKLLMSIGYPRNMANQIAWNYHNKKGKYTILDFMVENRKRKDREV